MDLPSPASGAIKTEPGTGGEVEGEIRDTDIDIDLTDIKKECLEYSERINSIAGKEDTFEY